MYDRANFPFSLCTISFFIVVFLLFLCYFFSSCLQLHNFAYGNLEKNGYKKWGETVEICKISMRLKKIDYFVLFRKNFHKKMTDLSKFLLSLQVDIKKSFELKNL